MPVVVCVCIMLLFYMWYVTNVTSSSSSSMEMPKNRVAFYSRCNYKGREIHHRRSADGLDTESEIGMDHIKSIWIPKGYSVTLYSREDQKGSHKILKNSETCLDHDTSEFIKSIKIQKKHKHHKHHKHHGHHGHDDEQQEKKPGIMSSIGAIIGSYLSNMQYTGPGPEDNNSGRQQDMRSFDAIVAENEMRQQDNNGRRQDMQPPRGR